MTGSCLLTAACRSMGKSEHLMLVGARDIGYKDTPDAYPTPRKAVESLLGVETFAGSVWEPACGEGAISRVLTERSIEVFSTDLHEYGYGTAGIDFMKCTGACDNIITNPPYNIGDAFIVHAVTLAQSKACFLMRLAWLAGQRRHASLFGKTPPARVWVFSARLPRMHRNGYVGPKSTSTIDFAWFVWDKSVIDGSTKLSWL